MSAIEKADQRLTEVIAQYGYSSAEALDAMDELDRLIIEDSVSNDGWSDAEIRAMNGEVL